MESVQFGILENVGTCEKSKVGKGEGAEEPAECEQGHYL